MNDGAHTPSVPGPCPACPPVSPVPSTPPVKKRADTDSRGVHEGAARFLTISPALGLDVAQTTHREIEQ